MTPPIKLSKETIQKNLSKVEGWQWDEENNEIWKLYKFKNYWTTIGFVNSIAWHAQKQSHHPDLKVSYGKCEVRLSTHDCDGLSEKDFILASTIEAL